MPIECQICKMGLPDGLKLEIDPRKNAVRYRNDKGHLVHSHQPGGRRKKADEQDPLVKAVVAAIDSGDADEVDRLLITELVTLVRSGKTSALRAAEMLRKLARGETEGPPPAQIVIQHIGDEVAALADDVIEGETRNGIPSPSAEERLETARGVVRKLEKRLRELEDRRGLIPEGA